MFDLDFGQWHPEQFNVGIRDPVMDELSGIVRIRPPDIYGHGWRVTKTGSECVVHGNDGDHRLDELINVSIAIHNGDGLRVTNGLSLDRGLEWIVHQFHERAGIG
jgi:hypothetical protein